MKLVENKEPTYLERGEISREVFSEQVKHTMPSILSKELSAKILGSEWSFGYNCYEVGHTW